MEKNASNCNLIIPGGKHHCWISPMDFFVEILLLGLSCLLLSLTPGLVLIKNFHHGLIKHWSFGHIWWPCHCTDMSSGKINSMNTFIYLKICQSFKSLQICQTFKSLSCTEWSCLTLRCLWKLLKRWLSLHAIGSITSILHTNERHPIHPSQIPIYYGVRPS